MARLSSSTALERAQAALSAGRVDEAIALLGVAAAASAVPAPLLHDRGCLLLATGALDEAVASFRAALTADAGFAPSHLRLGAALEALDDAHEALAAYRRAAGTDGGATRAEALYRAGALLEGMARRDEATDALSAAASAPGGSVASLLARARLLLAGADQAGADHAGAERTLRALLAEHPGHAEASDLLGTVLAEQGRAAESWAAHAAALARAPAFAGSFYDMALSRRIDDGDAPLVAKLEALAAGGTLRGEALVRLHLGLGKAADDRGDPAGAMRHFDAASALRDAPMAPATHRIVAHAARMRDLFARPSDTTSPAGDRPDAPILVCGLPRTGTTLVEQILAAHPAVAAGGELPFWSARAPLVPDALPDGCASDALGDAYRQTLARIGGTRRVTDKAPLNILHAGLVHLALPDARIVLCRRRPIDVALSIHRTWFNRLAGFPTGGEQLVDVIRALEALAEHWRAVLPPSRLLELRYEDLVDAPQRVVPALLEFCGLPFDQACLMPERSGRPVRTPSKWQVRRPITASDPKAWRRFEGRLGPLAALLTADRLPALSGNPTR